MTMFYSCKGFLTFIICVCCVSLNPIPGFGSLSDDVPSNNPAANYGIDWTEGFRWENVISIEEAEGDTPDQKLGNAQLALSEQGGGVVFFPEGTYHFSDHIRLKKGIVIRGSEPLNSEKHNPIVPHEFPKAFIDAREPRYTLGTHFVFPRYEPSLTGEGTPIETAFKGIRLENADDADFCGVVNIHIHNGHIALGEKEALLKNYKAQNMLGHMLVFGNILVNTAIPKPSVPASFQHKWQLFTDREYGAITVFACKNIFIANNSMPETNIEEDASFLMKGYRLYPSQQDLEAGINLTETDVLFDYLNRTGIRVNYLPMMHQLDIWTRYEEIEQAVQNGTYEALVTPGTLARGIVIRNNYIYTTGGGGIKTSGDGAWVAFNIIKCRPGVVLPSATGFHKDTHVNDVRAVEVRGWRWTIEGNDFEVHSNYTPDGIKYNDGEGLMHESWQNVGIRDSRIINNIGNRYICFWRVPVRGLLVSGNRLRIKPNWHAIFVNSQSRFSPTNLVDLPCENVVIENNITEGGGIKTLGENGPGNVIRNNRHTLLHEGKIENFTNSTVENNQHYIYIGPEE
jgi:hypothetical protein